MWRLAACCLTIGLVSCAAPPPPAAPRSSVGAFTVYFQSWSALVDAPMQDSIGKVAALVKAAPGDTVTVAGYADPDGSAKANQLLSQVRAQVVTDQLVADGVPASRINQAAVGAVQFAQTSQESRRVTMSVDKP